MLQDHLKIEKLTDFTSFFQCFERKPTNLFKERLWMTAAVTAQRKTKIVFTIKSLSKQSFSEQICRKLLRKEFFPLNTLLPLTRFSWKLRFGFFVEQIVQPTTPQFDIFNIKRENFFKCLTSTLIKTRNICIQFSVKFFSSQKNKHFMLEMFFD